MAPAFLEAGWSIIKVISFIRWTINRLRTKQREMEGDLVGPQKEVWLKPERKDWSGCARLGQKLIVAGGYVPAGTLQSTEVVDLETQQLTSGGDMATPRHWFHLATLRIGGNERLFAIGGKDGSASYTNTVEEWQEGNSTWKVADTLSETRGYYGAVVVPRELICRKEENTSWFG